MCNRCVLKVFERLINSLLFFSFMLRIWLAIVRVLHNESNMTMKIKEMRINQKSHDVAYKMFCAKKVTDSVQTECQLLFFIVFIYLAKYFRN